MAEQNNANPQQPSAQKPGIQVTAKKKTVSCSLIIGLVLLALVIIFAVANTHPVDFNLLFVRPQAPLVLIMLGSALFGAIIALLISWRIKKGKSEKNK